MTTQTDMAIPKARGEAIVLLVMYTIVVLFVIVAGYDLLNRIAVIPSVLWLGIITMLVASTCRSDGGLRKFFVNRVGDVAGRQFADTAVPSQVRIGYELLGHRVIQRSIPIDTIEQVNWCTGQATDMAGRDMNDWIVCVWFDHGNPEKSEKRRKWHRKPDQELYVVGPSTRKAKAEALGLELVSFLRGAGAALMQTDKTTCYIRRRPEKPDMESIQQPAGADLAGRGSAQP